LLCPDFSVDTDVICCVQTFQLTLMWFVVSRLFFKWNSPWINFQITMNTLNKMHYIDYLLFQVSSTCFGQCFRPSSGAL